MKTFLTIVLVLIFPYISVGISVRIAFTEKFVEWEYAKKDFPPDRWGMTREERLELAKLGLRAVLSDEGMEEFKSKRLKNGRNAFTKREIKHMEDVKNFLSLYFPSVYFFTLLWIFGIILLKEPRVLIFSGLFNTLLLIFLGILTFTNYKKAFEVFHNIVFDPYSWKFRYSDTLIRIYPLKFWYDATLFVAILSLIIGFLTIIAGMIWKKKGELKP